MGIHDIGDPGPPAQPWPLGSETEAALEAWREAMAADAKVAQMVRTLEATLDQLNLRRRHAMRVNQVAGMLAANTRAESLGNLAMDVLGSELSSRRGAFFALEGTAYVPIAALGAPLGSLVGYAFPAPNPFPDYPLVLFQSQWLEDEVHRGSLSGLKLSPESGLLFLPFEHQLFLMGFAIFSLPRDRALGEANQEFLEVMQHLFAIALNNAWLFRDLQQQRTELALQADALRQQAQSLSELQALTSMGQAMKGEFLAFASQEMARQLTEMLGLLRLGQGGAYSGAEAGGAFEEAYYLGQHMQALLADLTVLVKAESRPISIQPLAVADFLADLAQRLVSLPRRAGMEVEWAVLPSDLPEIGADGELLGLVLLHLLHSALFHAKEGPVSFQLERTPLTLAFRIPLRGVDLRPAAHVLRNPDLRGEELRIEGHAGAGLSLYVCQVLLERMGGRLNIEGGAERSDLVVEMPVV